jgi:hypothetical protein
VEEKSARFRGARNILRVAGTVLRVVWNTLRAAGNVLRVTRNDLPLKWSIFRADGSVIRAAWNVLRAERNQAGTVPARPSRTPGREGNHHRGTENTEEGKEKVD